MRRLEAIVEKTESGYSAFIEEVPGVIATGENFDEIKTNLNEALEFHLEGLKEFGEEIPDVLQEEYSLSFHVEVESFFDWFEGILTKSGVGRITGINRDLLNQYAKGIKKPGPKQRKKIETALHKFGQDLLQIKF